MRLDKLLSEMGIATRSEARSACKAGQVLVDGAPLRDSSAHVDPERQSVVFRGREISYRKYTYVMLNKPEGYVSATEDSKLPVVTELLDGELRKMELFPVGRLDRDTTGLMILTNNGPLAHRVLSPKHHVPKVYRFSAAEPMADGVEELFRDGVTLADGYECKSAVIVLDSDRMGGFITLTPDGEAVAQKIYERHTLLTRLLVNLGVSPETAAEDACKLEHAISDESFEAIKKHVQAFEK